MSEQYQVCFHLNMPSKGYTKQTKIIMDDGVLPRQGEYLEVTNYEKKVGVSFLVTSVTHRVASTPTTCIMVEVFHDFHDEETWKAIDEVLSSL